MRKAVDGNNAWDRRKELLGQPLTKYRPIGIGMQEGLGFQLEYVPSHLTKYQQSVISRHGNTEGEYSDYDTARLKLQEDGHF